MIIKKHQIGTESSIWTISLDDISYKQSSGDNYEFNVTVNNQNVNGNINVTIRGQDKTTGLITKESSKVESVSGLSTKNFIISIDTANIDYFHMYADEKNDVIEAVETDNYVIVPFVKKKEKAYLDINTGNSKADEAIRGYLKLFVQEVPESSAAFVIAVGKDASKVTSLNEHTRRNYRWYYDKNKNVPYFNEAPVGFTAYTGLVGRFFKDGKSHIFAYGKNIEGDVAAVKKLISSKNIMLTKDPFNIGSLDLAYAAKFTLAIDEKDINGLSVMDLMHNNENNRYYNAKSGTDGDNFKQIVEDILLDNNFEIAIKTVQTTNDNTTLRLKNANTDYSTTFKDAIVTNQKPVVLSRGIHSNLLTWEDFAKDIATDPKNARDAWLIEMVGGPTIDEDCKPKGTYNCPNYTFSDLKTFYWPALIAGVEKYSGQNQIDYVGYSLGCSAALESLKLYGSSGKNNAGYYFDTSTGTYLLTDLASNPVDTFVAVACPGNFSKISTFIEAFNLTKERRFQKYNSKNIIHIRGSQLRSDIANSDFEFIQKNYPSLFSRIDWGSFLFNGIIHPGDYRMSKNIYDEFYNWINNETGPDIGKGVSVNNLLVVQGKTTFLGAFSSGIHNPTEIDKNSDTVVPSQDSKDLCSNVNSNNKYYVSFKSYTHGGIGTTIASRPKVQDQIKFFLSERRILPDEKNYQFNQNCETI